MIVILLKNNNTSRLKGEIQFSVRTHIGCLRIKYFKACSVIQAVDQL